MLRRLRDDAGQASVEFVALLPLLALLAAGVWQLAVAGHAVWASGAAARAAARAAAVSGEDGARSAARRLAPAARVEAAGDGRVTVAVPVRAVVGGATLWTATTTAGFEAQR